MMTTEGYVTESRERLKELLRERAYKRGSKYKTPSQVVGAYFDFLEISLKHQGIELAGALLYEEIKDLDIQAVGGPNHGIASILCRAAFLKQIGVFYVRDNIKKQGDILAPKWIESRIKAADRVAVAGDVVSTGSQIIRTIGEVMQLGGRIVKIIVMIDWEKGGVEKIRQFCRLNQVEAPIAVLFSRREIIAPEFPGV